MANNNIHVNYRYLRDDEGLWHCCMTSLKGEKVLGVYYGEGSTRAESMTDAILHRIEEAKKIVATM